MRVADGEEQTFQLSVPELEAWGPEKMQGPVDEMGRHILTELERTRGRQHLEEATIERQSEDAS